MAPTKMKTSSSAETFNNNKVDPFDFLGGSGLSQNQSSNVTLKPQQQQSTTTSSHKTTADDLVSKMLNDLDMNKPKTSGAQQQQQMNMPKSRPNYNVSFGGSGSGVSHAASKINVPGNKKVSSNTFEDLLGKDKKNRGHVHVWFQKWFQQ